MRLHDWYVGDLVPGGTTPLSMLVLQPTPFCNIACKYCYLADTSSRERMSDEVIGAVCQRLHESGFTEGPLKVLWHAGEPLVPGPQYYQSAFERMRRSLPTGIRASHAFQTNATLLTPAFADLIDEWSVNIGVSLDGPASLHDANRRTRSDKGTHAKVMAGIRLLQQRHIPFTVICVISEASLSLATELIEFFASASIDDIGFNIEEVEGSHDASSLNRSSESLDRFRRFFAEVLEAAEVHRIRIRESEQMRGFVLREGSIFSTLQNPFSIISVDWRGDFTTFSPELLTDSRNRFVLGNVLTDSFHQSARSSRYLNIASAIRDGRDACRRSCEYFDVCGGGSPSNKVYEHNSFSATETTQCRYMRQAVADVVLARIENSLGLVSN